MSEESDLRPVIDRDECFGFGFCVDLLPSVFQVDGTGHAVVIGAAADPALLAQAAGDCPRSAINLVHAPRAEPGGLAAGDRRPSPAIDQGQAADQPASMWTMAPLTKRDSSDAR